MNGSASIILKKVIGEQASFVTAAGLCTAILANLPRCGTPTLLHFHRLRYSELDLDKPFLEQFQRNQVKLLAILARMTAEI